MRWNHSTSVCSSTSVSRQSTGSWKCQSGANVCLVFCPVSAMSLYCSMLRDGLRRPVSDVQGLPIDREGGLPDRLAERGVGVDVAADLPGIALEQPGQRGLADQLGGLHAD